MQLDVYRRPEPEHKLSYMVVPAGKPIPQEVDNVDWKLVASARELDVDAPALQDLSIDAPAAQIREKGYAITSVTHQVPED
jgi:hypothetical protein